LAIIRFMEKNEIPFLMQKHGKEKQSCTPCKKIDEWIDEKVWIW